MGGRCSDGLNIVPETIVLAFDVLGWTSPSDAGRIARSREVSDAMKKEISAQGRKIIQKHFQGEEVTQADAFRMLEGAGMPLFERRKKDLERRLACAYRTSPLGAWLDRNQWVLYIVLPVIVGGAGTYMYIARVGDTPARWAESLASGHKKVFKIQHLGKLELGSKRVKFVPSKREISGKIFGRLKLERLSLNLTVGGGFTDGEVAPAAVSAAVSTALSRNLRLSGTSSAEGLGSVFEGKSTLGMSYRDPSPTGFSLDLQGTLGYDARGVSSAGGSAGLKLRGQWDGRPASLGLQSGYKRNLRGSKPAHEHEVMLKLSVGL